MLLLTTAAPQSRVKAQKTTAPVKILLATSREWVSGVPGGRSGITYTIKAQVLTNKKVSFRNLWMKKDNVPFDIQYFTQQQPERLQSGDSLLLVYNFTRGAQNNSTGDDAVRLPVSYNGAALIECVVDGKARYFIVKAFKQLQPLKGQ